MSLPYFPMYPTDFEGKTSHLTLVEDGAYNRLLRICWMTPGCDMPADEGWVMRRARAVDAADQDAVRAVLSEFFTVENGRFSNAKLKRIFATTNEAHQKRVSAGSKGGKAKYANSKDKVSSNAKAMPKQPEPEPEPYKKESTNVLLCDLPSSKPDRFDEFWERYPRKIAKPNAKKAYEKALKAHRHDDIMFGLSQHLSSMQGKEAQFIPHAATWLNGERFNDEPEQPTNNTNQRNPGIGSGTALAAAAVAERRIAGKGRCDGSDW